MLPGHVRHEVKILRTPPPSHPPKLNSTRDHVIMPTWQSSALTVTVILPKTPFLAESTLSVKCSVPSTLLRFKPPSWTTPRVQPAAEAACGPQLGSAEWMYLSPALTSHAISRVAQSPCKLLLGAGNLPSSLRERKIAPSYPGKATGIIALYGTEISCGQKLFLLRLSISFCSLAFKAQS